MTLTYIFAYLTEKIEASELLTKANILGSEWVTKGYIFQPQPSSSRDSFGTFLVQKRISAHFWLKKGQGFLQSIKRG